MLLKTILHTFIFFSLSKLNIHKKVQSKWKTRSRIQYIPLKYISIPFTKAQDTKSVVSMTFRVIIPARIRRTDTTNERFSERINRERFPPLALRHRCYDPLFLFVTHKKRSYRREVTYGIAYYTGIIPAGPIRDFSASVYDRLSFSLSLTTSILLFHQSRDAPQSHAHTRA